MFNRSAISSSMLQPLASVTLQEIIGPPDPLGWAGPAPAPCHRTALTLQLYYGFLVKFSYLFIAVNFQYCSLLPDDEIFNNTENLSLLAFSHSTQCTGAGYVYTIYIYVVQCDVRKRVASHSTLKSYTRLFQNFRFR